jgi:hypothetical protein
VSGARYDLGVPARRVAVVIWVAMVLVPLLFLGVVRALAPTEQLAEATVEMLLLATILASAGGLLLARVLPPRIPLSTAGGAHVGTLVRFVIGWGICVGVAIFPLVAYLLTRDERFLAPFAVVWLCIVFAGPTRARWRAALPAEPPPEERTVN